MEDVELKIGVYTQPYRQGNAGAYEMCRIVGFSNDRGLTRVINSDYEVFSIERSDSMKRISRGEFLNAAIEIFEVGVNKFEKAIIKGNKIELVRKPIHMPSRRELTASISALYDVPVDIAESMASLIKEWPTYRGIISIHSHDRTCYTAWKLKADNSAEGYTLTLISK